MAHIVVLGGGIGGVSCAYELKQSIRREDQVTLVSNKAFFQFTPSNPWVAVKWRSKDGVTIDLASVLPKHGVGFSAAGVNRAHPAENRVELGDGTSLTYDYLVIATGPELAFDEIEALAPSTTPVRSVTSITPWRLASGGRSSVRTRAQSLWARCRAPPVSGRRTSSR